MNDINLTDGFVYNEGIVRTNLDCHSCTKIFVAKINYDISGNHVIKCPFCGHLHYRVINKGIVTGGRYSSQAGPNIEVPTERMWADQNFDIKTSSATEHIRQRWYGDK